MKKLIYIALLSFAPMFGFSQVHVVGPNGDTGVGTANPTEKLEVKGDAKIDGNKIILGKDAGFELFRSNAGSSQFLHSGTSQYSFRALDYAAISFWTNGAGRMQITKDGDLKLITGQAYKPGGGTWASISDQRLKKNIQTYSGGINELMKINPVTFEYTDKVAKDSKEYVGVVAQEVEKVAPYMIEQFNLTDEEGEELKNAEYMAVDPNAFIYMLINAAKTQEVTNQNQALEIERLNEELSSLKTVLESIKNADTGINDANNELEQEPLNRATLLGNTPNPFDNSTEINYYLPETSETAVIQIFNTTGQVLQTVKLDVEQKGNNSIVVKLENQPAGLYQYSLIVDNRLVDTKKMVLK